MLKIQRALGKKAEIVASFKYPAQKKSFTIHPGLVFRLLARRPGTIADISAGLEISAPKPNAMCRTF